MIYLEVKVIFVFNLAPSKTDLNGQRMEEALNINLSLFFLQQVIIALNKKQLHIPYRNSMMTMCLRDSLGGNCKTRMIATVSGENADALESISTCRFSERVALIKNTAVINEIEDPALLIQKQKNEIDDLRSELAMLKGKEQKQFLEENDIIDCRKIAENYLKSTNPNEKICLSDMLMIQEVYYQIKLFYLDLEKKTKGVNNSQEVILNDNLNLDKLKELESINSRLNLEIKKLKDMLQRKDEEMKILIDSLDKFKHNNFENINKNIEETTLLSKLQIEEMNKFNEIKNNLQGKIVNFENYDKIKNEIDSKLNKDQIIHKTDRLEKEPFKEPVPLSLLKDINTANSYLVRDVELNKEILSEQLKAYDVFKKNYIKTQMREEYLLNQKAIFSKGKELSEEIPKLKSNADQLRKEVFNYLNY